MFDYFYEAIEEQQWNYGVVYTLESGDFFTILHCMKKVQLKHMPGHRPLESDIESACTYNEPGVLKHSLNLQV